MKQTYDCNVYILAIICKNLKFLKAQNEVDECTNACFHSAFLNVFLSIMKNRSVSCGPTSLKSTSLHNAAYLDRFVQGSESNNYPHARLHAAFQKQNPLIFTACFNGTRFCSTSKCQKLPWERKREGRQEGRKHYEMSAAQMDYCSISVKTLWKGKWERIFGFGWMCARVCLMPMLFKLFFLFFHQRRGALLAYLLSGGRVAGRCSRKMNCRRIPWTRLPRTLRGAYTNIWPLRHLCCLCTPCCLRRGNYRCSQPVWGVSGWAPIPILSLYPSLLSIISRVNNAPASDADGDVTGTTDPIALRSIYL